MIAHRCLTSRGCRAAPTICERIWWWCFSIRTKSFRALPSRSCPSLLSCMSQMRIQQHNTLDPTLMHTLTLIYTRTLDSNKVISGNLIIPPALTCVHLRKCQVCLPCTGACTHTCSSSRRTHVHARKGYALACACQLVHKYCQPARLPETTLFESSVRV